MKSGVIDKRIIKTQNAIKGAFRELVQTKEMADISISELTKKANVTRSTFYMYYDTVGAVRDDIENEIIERLDQIMNESDLAQSMSNPYPLLATLAQETTKYDEYNRYILSSNNSGQLLEKVNALVVKAFMRELAATDPTADAARAKYVAAFFAAGICECFKMWYNHQSSLTLEDLCRRLSTLASKGLAIANSPDADF